MYVNNLPVIAVVTQSTRMTGLKMRWATPKAAAFRMQHAAEHEVERRRNKSAKSRKLQSAIELQEIQKRAQAHMDDQDLVDEDEVYQRSVSELIQSLNGNYLVTRVERQYLANFSFPRCTAVVVIGRDGLVANTAKYVGDLPIVGVNPDPQRNDGVLLPFQVRDAAPLIHKIVQGLRFNSESVVLAEVNTNDGQRMLAFNDFFVGCATHTSARYTLEVHDQIEPQSSSGVLISTGAGSTGWMSSVFHMANGFARLSGLTTGPNQTLNRQDRKLFWCVREPFVSRHSSASLVCGFLNDSDELVLGSQMTERGVIFSDGIETDFLEFNAGTIARFTVASQRARLVVPGGKR